MTNPFPFGKYLLLDRLNAGGMAEVFLAKVFGRDGQDRLVALKRILPSLLADDEFVGMFLDEARIAVQLDHRNLVQIFELGRHEANYYIAMEYLSGCDLRTALDRSKKRHFPLSLEQILFVIGEIAAGLDHAHRARDRRGESLAIVHRDVSPQNVVLASDGQIKLIDFGIAKVATRQQATQVGILKGKFGYMSPEQARGVPIDRRSDIFSLGIIFHELLTGQRLFTGETEFAVLERVRAADVAAPRKSNPAVPPEIERIVLKALAREPAARYSWASELIEDLRAFLGRETSEGGAQSLAAWMRQALAEELDQERERLRLFAKLPRPPEMEPVALESVSGAHRFSMTDTTGTLIFSGSTLEVGFEVGETSLMTDLPRGFPSEPSRTEVLSGLAEAKRRAAAPAVPPAAPPEAKRDRWEDTTRPPLPMHLWVAESEPPRGRGRDRTSRPEGPPPAGQFDTRPMVRIAAASLAAVAFVAAGAWLSRASPSTGSLAVTARPATEIRVEIDNQPLVLGKDGSALARNLRPGAHFLRAEGPLGRRALWVTVIANETASVDLVFPQAIPTAPDQGPGPQSGVSSVASLHAPSNVDPDPGSAHHPP